MRACFLARARAAAASRAGRGWRRRPPAATSRALRGPRKYQSSISTMYRVLQSGCAVFCHKVNAFREIRPWTVFVLPFLLKRGMKK